MELVGNRVALSRPDCETAAMRATARNIDRSTDIAAASRPSTGRRRQPTSTRRAAPSWKGLLSPDDGCAGRLYPDDKNFRSKIVMAATVLAAANTNISPIRCPT
jgi:hypothetical protein